MSQQAKGTFEVKRSAEPACDMGDGVEAGHFRFDKTFDGPLDATSVVHMLAAVTADARLGRLRRGRTRRRARSKDAAARSSSSTTA